MTAATPPDDPEDAAALARYAAALADAVELALPGWVERAVEAAWRAGTGEAPSAELRAAAADAGRQAQGEVGPALRALLAADVDAQWTNPLAIVRTAVAPATAVLRAAGLAPVDRDADAVRLFPDDAYDLTPAAFGDLDPAVHEPGLLWGAAKAHVVLRRRRPRDSGR